MSTKSGSDAVPWASAGVGRWFAVAIVGIREVFDRWHRWGAAIIIRCRFAVGVKLEGGKSMVEL